ncbi:response regulator [Dehalogenimonas etheniformans]|uniref:DNA-binding response regulator n=1 Tax=Dehalogenimonas etheniformans TaxID=1536648 RepID=A0A2P5P4T0_9CHLR|nr:response regulator transcription factor [Dehalogenimonas etheniformans]PPD57301.1 DNA-binding response regulator [Dehalogenimonas etheniformans]QNT77016.1 response regulator transcription factor [Dehalogenimonas etheniformans]
MITIVIADDHKVVRQGLRNLLEMEPDLKVVGEAANGSEALALVENQRPDILVTDISMPPPTGIELAKIIRQKGYPSKVVVLSMHADEPFVVSALTAGALGYVLKEAGVEYVVTAIREAAANRRFVSPPLVMPDDIKTR